MKNEIRLSHESVWLIWMAYIGNSFAKGIKLIFHGLTGIIAFIFGGLFKLWNKLYEVIDENKRELTKILLKILALVEAILFIIFCFQYFYNQRFLPTLPIWMGGIASGVVLLFLLMKLYHEMIGRQAILQIQIKLTDLYVCHKLASIIKIFGPPRIGKDTTGISITSILVRFFRFTIQNTMAYIRKIGYIFDFKEVEKAAWIYQEWFYQPSRIKRREAFIRLCGMPEYRCFLKDRYFKQIDYQKLLEEYRKSQDNKVDFKSRYMYDSGIAKLHFLDLLNEYIFLYVRLYVLKNFVMINQPYLEDPATGLMGKVNSVYYMALASHPDEERAVMLPNGSKAKIKYKEKVEFPLLDWTIWYETENDTWFSNQDSAVLQLINDYKLRDFKAFYGHFFKHFHIIQICHDAQRMNKKLRELDACYINILNREEIPGAQKRNAVLSFLQKITDYFANKGEVKEEKKTEHFHRFTLKKYDFYGKLYQATMNDKYLLKMEVLRKKKIKEAGFLTEWFKRRNKWLLERIEQNRRKYGIIRITATISDQPVARNLQETSLKKLLDRDKPMFHEAYKVDLYFRMTDSMGRYNDRYMEEIAESRALESLLDFYHVLNWDKRMQITREIIVRSGYPAGRTFMSVTKEELFETRYIPINEKQ